MANMASILAANARASVGTIDVEQIEYHRNGICGAPFHVVLFSNTVGEESRSMLAIVFEEENFVAVLDRTKLAAGDIRFGSNSWRGDRFEGVLRDAIQHQEETALTGDLQDAIQQDKDS